MRLHHAEQTLQRVFERVSDNILKLFVPQDREQLGGQSQRTRPGGVFRIGIESLLVDRGQLAVGILGVEVREDMLLEMIGKPAEDTNVVIELAVLELQRIAAVDRVENRREDLLHVLGTAFIDARCSDGKKHRRQSIPERTENPARSRLCCNRFLNRIGLPFVSSTAPLLRPAVRDGKRVNSRSGSQAVHQAGHGAYQKAKGCAST